MTPPDTKAEVIEQILSLVDDGKSLRQACKEIDFPRKTFEGWLEADEELSAQYARARENRAEKIFEEILTIADRPAPTTDSGATDSGDVQHRRLQIDARKWMLGKMSPKKYGDKIDLEHSGSVKTYSDFDLSKLSTEELVNLRRMREKAATDAPPEL